MTHAEFLASTESADQPPTSANDPLKALWWAKRGDWERAHTIAQEVESTDGSWIHAYLHRVEGDESNAGYWYARAGKPHSTASLDDEWASLVSAFLEN